MAWITEDGCILKLLFEPEKAKTLHSSEEACTIRHGRSPEWTRLFEKAQQEGVAPLLYHHITKHRLEHLIPRECVQILSHHYHTNLKRNMTIVGRLREVLAKFREAGIPCIVLKGIALAENVYPNIAVRGMSDVDILIRRDDLFKADEFLFSLGYVSRDSSAAKAIHNPLGYLASLDYRKDGQERPGLNLHIHWHPVNTSVPATMFAGRVDLDRLWDRAVETAVADSPALMLCPEHLIIYLCEHALRVGHSFDRLILVCDIYFSIKTFEHRLDWDFMAEESRRLGLSRFVYFGLSIVQHYTSLDIPGNLIAKLEPKDISPGERLFLRLQRSNRRIRGSSCFIYLAMNRGSFAKLRFIIRIFFPPAQIILQRQYRKDDVLSHSFYLARIGEILSHIGKLLAPGPANKPKNP